MRVIWLTLIGLITLGANSSVFANSDWQQIYLCMVTEVGGQDVSQNQIGKKHLMGVNTFISLRLTELFPSGLGVIRDCDEVGHLLVCEIEGSMTRKIVFDTVSSTLVSPYGFSDGYAKSLCEPHSF